MNPIIREIMDNIGRLGRELENSSPSNLSFCPQENGRTTGHERTHTVEGEVSRIFRRSSAQPSPSSTSNVSFTSTVSSNITATTSSTTVAQQSASAMTPRFRLSYNFSNSRSGQNTRKKGKAINDKKPNGQFVKDVILLGGPDQDTVPRQGARVWLMENGHIVAGAVFRKEWSEKALHDFLKSLFPSKLEAFDDFELVMSVHSRLMAPVLAPGQALSGFLLQKVFKDKPVYIRPMRDILPIEPLFKRAKHNSEELVELTEDEMEEEKDLMNPVWDSTQTTSSAELSQDVPQDADGRQRNTPSDQREVQSPLGHGNHDTLFVPDGEQTEKPRESVLGENQKTSYTLESELERAVNSCIDYCLEKSIEDPVEILRCVQRFLLCGRPLDVSDPSVILEGETNFILVNRENVFQSAKEEFESISVVTNPRVTLEVSFYGEGAVDFGGPRREFFRLCLQEIKRDYFDSGLKEHLSDDYVFVGTVMALSVLQNGNIPRFLCEEQLQELFGSGEPSSECLRKLRSGFEKVGIYQIGNALPFFLHLFRPSPASVLSRRKLLDLLKPQFSAEGSNARMDENSTYQAFLRYIQQAASGHRESVALGHVLHFVTGTDEEPPLGFTISPSIEFPRSEDSRAWSFLPMANTCSNTLHLPRCVSSNNCQLPDDKDLFQMYDYAFCSAFFGKK